MNVIQGNMYTIKLRGMYTIKIRFLLNKNKLNYKPLLEIQISYIKSYKSLNTY